MTDATFHFYFDDNPDGSLEYDEQYSATTNAVGVDGRARAETRVWLPNNKAGKVVSFGLMVFTSIPGESGVNQLPSVFHLVEVVEAD